MQRFRICETGYPYFVTMSVVKWLPVFVSAGACNVILDSLRYCRSEKGLRIHCYVIMPTHVHLIVSTEGDLSAVLRDLKRFTAKRIVEVYESVEGHLFTNVFRFCGRDNRPPTAHKVWQDGNHPEMIRTEGFYRQKAEYIQGNPLRKGLVTDALAWAFSSAKDYYGVSSGPLEIDGIEW